MADLFISYKREDRRLAERLSISLEQLGFDVWWDFELLSGDGFRKIIERVIDECSATIVLWSELSRDSTFVVDEATYSRDQNKLCPARIDDCRLPLGFGGDHVVDLRGWEGEMGHDGLQGLIRALEAKTGKKARLGARARGQDEEARFAEMEAFKAAEAAGNVSALQSFLLDYPQGTFSTFVRGQLQTMGAEAPRVEAVAGGAPARGLPPREPPRPAPAVAREPAAAPERKSSPWGWIAVAGVVALAATVALLVQLPRTAPPPAITTTTIIADIKPPPATATYDLNALNADVRASAVQARANEALATTAATRARAIAQQAADAPVQGALGVQTFDGQFAGDRYAGQYAAGRFAGLGVYAWGDNANNSFGGLRVEGEFATDAPNGDGAYFWRDGKRYAGRLSNWRREGAGVFYFADGRRYEGNWADDKENGYGVRWDANGGIEAQGVWTDGVLTTPLS